MSSKTKIQLYSKSAVNSLINELNAIETHEHYDLENSDLDNSAMDNSDLPVIRHSKSKAQLLIEAINAMKRHGHYDMANSAMAVLINQVLDPVSREEVTILLETPDECGEYPEQVYFDLLVVRHDNTEQSACIPVPLVERNTMIALMKGIEIVDREEHNRRYADDPLEQKVSESLLLCICTPKEISRCVAKYLDTSDDDDLVDRLHAHWRELSETEDACSQAERFLKDLMASKTE